MLRVCAVTSFAGVSKLLNSFRCRPLILLVLMVSCGGLSARGQVREDQLGAWYMYFWNASIKERLWGFQGDVQYRSWDGLGDLEQLMLRGGWTIEPRSRDVKFTLGYANISTGTPGESNSITQENRVYQEALMPHKVMHRVHLTHRFRYEQRWVEGQRFRTRYRYNIFLNLPLNQKDLKKGAVYLALYNELFINGQRNIGNGRSVEVFDRNRFYSAMGYSLSDRLRLQGGIMQQTTDRWSKLQLQFSAHHAF